MVRGQCFRLSRPLSIVLLPVGTGQEPVFHIGKMWLEQLIKPARALGVVCLPKPSAGGAKAVLRKGWFFKHRKLLYCLNFAVNQSSKKTYSKQNHPDTTAHPVGPLLLNTYKLKPYVLLVGIWQLSNVYVLWYCLQVFVTICLVEERPGLLLLRMFTV